MLTVYVPGLSITHSAANELSCPVSFRYPSIVHPDGSPGVYAYGGYEFSHPDTPINITKLPGWVIGKLRIRELPEDEFTAVYTAALLTGALSATLPID